MKIVAVIPARMGSSRFPGKPLARLRGLTMIEHIYHRTALCRSLDAIYVATCDEEIRKAAVSFGCKAIMTSPAHQRPSDRVAEAAKGLEADIVVMVQGDEPLLRPEMIELAVAPLVKDSSILCSNLVARIKTLEEFNDPNTIKVVIDKEGFALYFSRKPIPTENLVGWGKMPAYKQVCLIPFRRDFLFKYPQLEPTPLEKAESVDMLRILEHGYKVKLIESPYKTHAVDTPGDLKLVERMMESDPLLPLYIGRSS